MGEYDYRKLAGRIREVCGTQRAFAKAIGRGELNVSMKMLGKRMWQQNDIAAACEALGIRKEEIGAYFFTGKSGQPEVPAPD